LIFGDFKPPDQPLVFGQLRIIIEPEKLTDTVVRSALTVLKAHVAVPDKSVASVRDAVRRLNLLVGLLSYTNQGAPVRWWSYVTSSPGGGLSFKLGERNPDLLLSLLDLLDPDARRRVAAALYWIREPRGMILEYHRSDQLAVFAGYWNAFECLVDAVESLVPQPRPTRSDNVAAIRARCEKTGNSLGPGDIADLYREVVDPGLRHKAEHALRICLGDKAQHYLAQCFAYTPPVVSRLWWKGRMAHASGEFGNPSPAACQDGHRRHTPWKRISGRRRGRMTVGRARSAR
jgi:hypothetical protein